MSCTDRSGPEFANLQRRDLLRSAVSLGGALVSPYAIGQSGDQGAAWEHSKSAAAHLLNRAAFGARPGDIEHIQSTGLTKWLAKQMQPEPSGLPAALASRLARLETMHMPLGELLQAYQQRVDSNGQGGRPIVREVQEEVVTARLLRLLDSPWQLEEVLTDFWYNHFNVFIAKGLDRVMVGRYEYDAIRPHVFGRFRDMLIATAMHPAMLFYLDQWNSSARNGINENYAREVLELHTLGVDGGYSQKDVSELARILSGWTFDRRAPGNDLFRFDERRHDPGAKQFLGRAAANSGFTQGVWALDTLAVHRSTARHLALKLAQYFVADNPSPALVQALADTFERSSGDLKQVYTALFKHPEFWSSAGSAVRFKTPLMYVASAARAADISNPLSPIPLGEALQSLGMPLFGCPTPDGYSPFERAWLGPEAISRRVQFASRLGPGQIAALTPAGTNARLASSDANTVRRNAVMQALGPLLRPATQEVVMSAPSDQQVALLLSSPEFLRR